MTVKELKTKLDELCRNNEAYNNCDVCVTGEPLKYENQVIEIRVDVVEPYLWLVIGD